jgi:hypothetical protein
MITYLNLTIILIVAIFSLSLLFTVSRILTESALEIGHSEDCLVERRRDRPGERRGDRPGERRGDRKERKTGSETSIKMF